MRGFGFLAWVFFAVAFFAAIMGIRSYQPAPQREPVAAPASPDTAAPPSVVVPNSPGPPSPRPLPGAVRLDDVPLPAAPAPAPVPPARTQPPTTRPQSPPPITRRPATTVTATPRPAESPVSAGQVGLSADGYYCLAASGSSVFGQGCEVGGSGQTWTFTSGRLRRETGCLTASGDSATLTPCGTGGAGQRWSRQGGRLVAAGGRCLGATQTDGMTVRLTLESCRV